jgi:hypothetical protein
MPGKYPVTDFQLVSPGMMLDMLSEDIDFYRKAGDTENMVRSMAAYQKISEFNNEQNKS